MFRRRRSELNGQTLLAASYNGSVSQMRSLAWEFDCGTDEVVVPGTYEYWALLYKYGMKEKITLLVRKGERDNYNFEALTREFENDPCLKDKFRVAFADKEDSNITIFMLNGGLDATGAAIYTVIGGLTPEHIVRHFRCTLDERTQLKDNNACEGVEVWLDLKSVKEAWQSAHHHHWVLKNLLPGFLQTSKKKVSIF